MTIAALMQPLKYNLRGPAAKGNSATHAAMGPSNLDATTTLRFADTKLQSTKELRAKVRALQLHIRMSTPKQKKKTILKLFLKEFLKGKSPAPTWRKYAAKFLLQRSCGHSNTIYDVQLQKTIVLCTQRRRQATLTQPLQWDLQPEC